jgi:hypothetical protein
MQSAAFRKWLAERGYRFGAERREEDYGTVTVHRLGRTAEMPLGGASSDIDARAVREVCDALGLDWSKLPGPAVRTRDDDKLA